jgi:hypothetical protein
MINININYLEPDLTGPNVAEELLELCGILLVGDVPDEQTHLLFSFLVISYNY